MTKLIDADALWVSVIQSRKETIIDDDVKISMGEFVKLLDNAPTVEPKLSNEQIEKITDLLETEWGYEGIREDVSRILREADNERKKLEKAMNIKESLKAIDKLRHILCVPYPTMHDGTTDVSFVCFDATTRESLKQTICDTLDKREKELNEEFENL